MKEFKTKRIMSYWKNRKKEEIAKDVFIASIQLGVSGFDLVKDCFLAYQYLEGDYYTYSLNEPSDWNCLWIGKMSSTESGQSVKISCEPDCTWIQQDIDIMPGIIKSKDGKSIMISCQPDCSWLEPDFDILKRNNQTSEVFDYLCFEKDIYWGSLTLAFIYLSGLALFIRLVLTKEARKNLCSIFLTILAALFFPLTLLVVKIVSLIQFGEEWKRFASLVTICEGQVESFFQAILQLYIIYGTKRQISFFQCLALIGSFAMIAVGQVKAAFVLRSPGESIFEDTKKMASYAFGSFAVILGFIYNAVLIALIDKLIFFASFGSLMILLFIYFFISRLDSSCKSKNGFGKQQLKCIMLSLVWLIGFIDGIIALVLVNMDPDRYSSNTVLFETQILTNIELVMIATFNLLLFIMCLLRVFNYTLDSAVLWNVMFCLGFTASFLVLFDKIVFVSLAIALILLLIYFCLIGCTQIQKRKITWIMLSLVCLIGFTDYIISLVLFNLYPGLYRLPLVIKMQSVGNAWLLGFAAYNLYILIWVVRQI